MDKNKIEKLEYTDVFDPRIDQEVEKANSEADECLFWLGVQ